MQILMNDLRNAALGKRSAELNQASPEEREIALAVRSPAQGDEPERGEAFRGLVYKHLSPMADIVFRVGVNDSVVGFWIQKYIGNAWT